MQTERDAWRAAGRPWPRGEPGSRMRRGRTPWLSSPGVAAAVRALERRNHGTPPRRRDDDDGEDVDGDEGNVDGCPEALLPGALTRRLSACRPRLTLPPSLPPVPPSYPRLASSSGSSPCALWPSAFSRFTGSHLCFCPPRHYHSRSRSLSSTLERRRRIAVVILAALSEV